MRRRVGTLLLCSFLLPLAACGDNGDGDTASSPTTKATTAATAAAGETADDSSGSTDEPAEAPDGGLRRPRVSGKTLSLTIPSSPQDVTSQHSP